MLLDPFCGTGRALKVAIESGRNAIGFDVLDSYVDVARRACVESDTVAPTVRAAG